MFDIGFWELALIGVIALLVVGPDRFPGLVRSAGYWLGRGRQMLSSVKTEFQSEVDKAEQLKQLIEEQNEMVLRQEAMIKEQLEKQLAAKIDAEPEKSENEDERKPVPAATKVGMNVEESAEPAPQKPVAGKSDE